jgi:hypothetical protein
MNFCFVKSIMWTKKTFFLFLVISIFVISACENSKEKSVEIYTSPFYLSAYSSPFVFSSIIGRSVNDKALKVTAVGSGHIISLVIIGAIHGNEQNTEDVVRGLMNRYKEHPDLVPPGMRLFFLPLLNPDGFKESRRKNARGVDLNRNFPTSNWRSDAVSPHKISQGSGGENPGSEPEVQALIRWLMSVVNKTMKKVYLISYHAAYKNGAVQPGYRIYKQPEDEAIQLAQYIANVSGYTYLRTWITSLPITGELINWCGENEIVAADIELPTYKPADIIPPGKSESTRQTHERVLENLIIYLQEDLSGDR